MCILQSLVTITRASETPIHLEKSLRREKRRKKEKKRKEAISSGVCFIMENECVAFAQNEIDYSIFDVCFSAVLSAANSFNIDHSISNQMCVCAFCLKLYLCFDVIKPVKAQSHTAVSLLNGSFHAHIHIVWRYFYISPNSYNKMRTDVNVTCHFCFFVSFCFVP